MRSLYTSADLRGRQARAPKISAPSNLPNLFLQVNIYELRSSLTLWRNSMHNPTLIRTALLSVCAFCLVAAAAGSASARRGGLGGLGNKLKKKTPNLLGDKQP